MVIPNAVSWPIARGLLLADAATPDALPPAKRAAALMALVIIVLIGVLFIAAILVGGHWVRRQGNVRRGPSVPPDRAPIASPSTDAHTADSDHNLNDPPDDAWKE